MSKRAEEYANAQYPQRWVNKTPTSSDKVDYNERPRWAAMIAYEQAEEDYREEIASIKAKLWQDGYDDGHKKAEKEFALTWKDIPIIIGLCEQVKTEWWFRDMKGIGTQKHFEEVLRRFNEQRKK